MKDYNYNFEIGILIAVLAIAIIIMFVRNEQQTTELIHLREEVREISIRQQRMDKELKHYSRDIKSFIDTTIITPSHRDTIWVDYGDDIKYLHDRKYLYEIK